MKPTHVMFDEICGDSFMVEKYKAFVNGDFPLHGAPEWM